MCKQAFGIAGGEAKKEQVFKILDKKERLLYNDKGSGMEGEESEPKERGEEPRMCGRMKRATEKKEILAGGVVVVKLDLYFDRSPVYVKEREVEEVCYKGRQFYRLPEPFKGIKTPRVRYQAKIYAVERAPTLIIQGGVVVGSEEKVRSVHIGNVLAYYYPEVGAIEVWECYIFPDMTYKDPLGDWDEGRYNEIQRKLCEVMEQRLVDKFRPEKIYWHDRDIALPKRRYKIYLNCYREVENTNYVVKVLGREQC